MSQQHSNSAGQVEVSSASEALELLISGNRRFMAGMQELKSYATAARRVRLAEEGQRPFAVILTCADSRVPAELVFDRGLGDLFVLRVAGNVVVPSLIASVEFAASQFGTPLCVVMGHSQCGAIKSACTVERQGPQGLTPSLTMLMDKILPSVRKTRLMHAHRPQALTPERLIHETTLEHARRSASALGEESSLITRRLESGAMAIVPAVYDLHSGQVTFDLEHRLGGLEGDWAAHAKTSAEAVKA